MVRVSWLAAVLCCGLSLTSLAVAGKITLQVRDTPITEVIEMIARQQEVNILMPGDATSNVSLSLYEMPLEEALSAVASAAGFALEKQNGSYFILPRDQVGSYQNGNLTRLRVYDIDYVDGEVLLAVLQNHLSLYGKADFIPARNALIVQDKPDFLAKVDRLIRTLDRQPRQVMIEAKILEVALNDDEQLGIDWTNLFNSDGGSGSFGVGGNTGPLGSGFFFDLVTPNIEVALSALQDEGRLQTLSAPKLVALESEEASVVIGDRRGYQVTTTINQVTTESIEFLESGVILRVTAEIDKEGRVLLQVHPEVSTGAVDANGIPSQTTTEVTTQIVVPTGETIFIGGLMRRSETLTRSSVPGVNRVPLVRRLFSGTEKNLLTTETVVLIRPIIAEDVTESWNQEPIETIEGLEIDVPELQPWALNLPNVDPTVEVSEPPAELLEDSERLLSHEAPSSCAEEAVLFCYDDGCRCETE